MGSSLSFMVHPLNKKGTVQFLIFLQMPEDVTKVKWFPVIHDSFSKWISGLLWEEISLVVGHCGAEHMVGAPWKQFASFLFIF